MDRIEIENEILKYFYGCWETGLHCTIHSLFPILPTVSKDLIERIGEELDHKGYIKGLASTPYGDLTAWGILETERRELIYPEKIQRYGQARFRILEVANGVYSENGSDKLASFDDFDRDDEPNSREVDRNMDLLSSLGWIEIYSIETFYILPAGRAQFEEWNARKSIVDRWNEVESMKPHPRGVAFQNVIADAFSIQGFSVSTGLRRSHEEMDVVASVERVPYLMEMKWEAEKIGAAVVRELYGKISNRAEVRGILFSMSGFTDNDKGAVSQVIEYSSQKYILLFGPEDTKRIISNPANIARTIDSKLEKLMWKKVVEWE
ncbi:MAG: restriction endonuclease [bacterium]|nr:restriction endonuclease [bacterium]